jgi:cystathionine beta-lyase/cystathionine gamma-synthase
MAQEECNDHQEAAHRAPLLDDPLGAPRRAEARLRNAPGRIRLSTGLEDWHDIIRDLELALEKV